MSALNMLLAFKKPITTFDIPFRAESIFSQFYSFWILHPLVGVLVGWVLGEEDEGDGDGRRVGAD